MRGKYHKKSDGQAGDSGRERLQRRGPNTWNEREINLSGSGLSEVVKIGEAHILIAWTTYCETAQARSYASAHTLATYRYSNAPTESVTPKSS